ncbi:MAG: glycosyltransferase [Deltaproteobacteria bacterium]|nr:glycosyltransferase [Deltaproteobacteria bacterium]
MSSAKKSKSAPAIRTIVQLVLKNDTGDSFYRMRWPAQELARQDGTLRVINLSAEAKERKDWALSADLLVLFQSQDLDLLPIIEERRKLGRRTLVEYNDNFYEPAPWSPVAEAWSSPLLWQTYETILNASDGLIVTGPGLAELFASRTAIPIHVLPNYYPRDLPPFAQHPAKPGTEINVGWAGSLGHMADILSFAPNIGRLIADFPQSNLHLMGNETLPSLVHVPKDRLRFKPWGSMDQYFEFWLPIHIGIVPLLDTPYNRGRSDIKAVEIAASGALPILPDTLIYRDFIAATGVPTYRSLDEAEEILRSFMANPEKVRTAAERAYTYVRDRRLQSADSERLRLYSSMFPSTEPASASWPVGVGAHELDGTPELETETTRVLKSVQKQWNEKQRQEALAEIRSASERSPSNIEWSIAALRLTAAARDAAFPTLLQSHVTRFPRDLRAFLLAISVAEVQSRLELWKRVLQRLASDARSRDFFRAEVVRLALLDLVRVPGFDQVLPALGQLYPTSPEIHLALGELLERQGRFEQSLAHFDWLLRAMMLHEQGKTFFSSVDQGYIKAWGATLRARLRSNEPLDSSKGAVQAATKQSP